MAVPQRGAVLASQKRLEELLVTLPPRLVQKHCGIQHDHEVDGIAALLHALSGGLQLSLALLRDTRMTILKNTRMHKRRVRQLLHGIWQLCQLLVVTQVNHQAHAIIISQAGDIVIRAKNERARPKQAAATNRPTVRAGQASQISCVGQPVKRNAPVISAPRRHRGGVRRLIRNRRADRLDSLSHTLIPLLA